MPASQQSLSDCPDDTVFAEYLDNLLPAGAKDRFERHVDGCEVCRIVLAESARSAVDSAELGKPAETIGRFIILDTLGAGAMGIVHLAKDPLLERKVAVKLLRTSASVVPGQEPPLLLEARAMASLSHPNVITVFDVGTIDDQVFIAMEYVAGCNLSQWLAAEARPWSMVLETFIHAGSGLQAAHERGLVHRDFKPDNILIGSDGRVRVTDFGLASVDLSVVSQAPSEDEDAEPDTTVPGLKKSRSGPVEIAGTPAYMAPEQHLGDAPSLASDQFSFCASLYEALYGKRPFDGATYPRVRADILMGNVQPPPPDSKVPESVHRAILRGLSVEPADRYPSLPALLDEIEAVLPLGAKRVARLADDVSPYPGLVHFEEDDSERFFGRSREIQAMVTRLRDTVLLGVVGPSGVGKSSFVRAGLVPALKAGGESWEAFTIRPGYSPVGQLAKLVLPLTTGDSGGGPTSREAMTDKLFSDPGHLFRVLVRRARHYNGRVILFIDQFEELYTLVAAQEERKAFVRCLTAMAADRSHPVRVVISMRSEFLDRAAEHREFLEILTRGLTFLPPPDREGLKEALTFPLALAGYRFESQALVERMVDELDGTRGALPLLQFAASRLWQARDVSRRLLTEEGYERVGAIAGALAVHADEVLSRLPTADRQLTRALFQRLVTPDRTREIVGVDELVALGADRDRVQSVVSQLVDARLLVVHQSEDFEGAAIELVHESLITSWPTLGRWLDENKEDAQFLAEVRSAAKQWHSKGRPQGLLWRGAAVDDARRRSLPDVDLSPRERDFLAEAIALETRASRLKRLAVGAVIAVLVALVAAGSVTLLIVREAEQKALDQAELAAKQAVIAADEAARARGAEETISKQLDELTAKEEQRLAAIEQAKKATEKEKLSYEQLAEAYARAQQEEQKAKAASKEAKKANAELKDEQARLEKYLKEEKQKVQRLKEERSKINDTLKR